MSDNVFIVTGGLEKAIGKTIVHAGLYKNIEQRDGITSAANIVVNEDGKVVIRTSEYSVEHLTFFLQFDDGNELHVFDDAQHCCEHRYLTCDDDCSVLIGGKLLNVELATINETEDFSDNVHQIGIVKIESEKGYVVLCTHNEHNGYYGGFNLTTVYYERKEIDKGNSM